MSTKRPHGPVFLSLATSLWMVGVMLLSWLLFLGPGVSTLARLQAPFGSFLDSLHDAFGYVASPAGDGGQDP